MEMAVAYFNRFPGGVDDSHKSVAAADHSDYF